MGRFAEVLDSVSSASDLTKLETIYELTLDALKATANQRPGREGKSRLRRFPAGLRLWFSTSVKLAKLHLEMGPFLLPFLSMAETLGEGTPFWGGPNRR